MTLIHSPVNLLRLLKMKKVGYWLTDLHFVTYPLAKLSRQRETDDPDDKIGTSDMIPTKRRLDESDGNQRVSVVDDSAAPLTKDGD